MKKQAQPTPGFMDALKAGFGLAAGGAIIAGTGAAVGAGIGAIKSRFAAQRNYRDMLLANPHLREHDAATVQAAYRSLRKMSPTMSSDPIIAGSFVRSMIELSPSTGLAVPPATAKMLAETEEAVSKARPEGVMKAMRGAVTTTKMPQYGQKLVVD